MPKETAFAAKSGGYAAPPPLLAPPAPQALLQTVVHIYTANKYKKIKKTPCKRWEVANVFHRIEKTVFQAFDFNLEFNFFKKVRTKKCIIYLIIIQLTI